MNVFEVLKHDHEMARDLFAQIERSGEKDRREELFQKLKQELIAHAHAEERIFYPVLKEKQQTHDQIEEGISEHHHVEQLLSSLENMDCGSDEWLQQVRQLKQEVEHHVHEEEEEIFPKAQQLLKVTQVIEMADKVQEVKDQELH